MHIITSKLAKIENPWGVKTKQAQLKGCPVEGEFYQGGQDEDLLHLSGEWGPLDLHYSHYNTVL